MSEFNLVKRDPPAILTEDDYKQLQYKFIELEVKLKLAFEAGKELEEWAKANGMLGGPIYKTCRLLRFFSELDKDLT